uniref:Uncharacterized protein n=1 Tax=Lactuca sativa TaxID=4236 RepID=A0A9R1XXI8_LACSA|nr:hypothetical protein LSAT_V11C100044120 [Lactuca sativa]
MRTMEGVVLKLPSFSQLISPNHLSNRTSLNFRFGFPKSSSSSSSSSTASLSVPAAAPVSLGHSTRPDFEILHQAKCLLNRLQESLKNWSSN